MNRSKQGGMARKTVVFLLAGLALAFVHIAEAQQPSKVPKIGFLVVPSRSFFADRMESFRQGLHSLGYVEGKNILIEYRYAEGKLDRLPNLAAELIRLKVDIIVVQSTTGLLINYHSTGRPDVYNSYADQIPINV
jgi:putative tryptophan/tyrosine transport system substrate-binding protein